jgi:AcrR family transcriptional regulator
MYKLCKSEQSAARQRELELGLLDLMRTRHYEEITVSEICNHLHIPRKSFYRYFSSKDGALLALVDHTMLAYEGFNVVYAAYDKRTPQKELQQFFEFWMQNKVLLGALEKSRLSSMLVERAMSYYTDDKPVALRFLQDEDDFQRRQRMLFCISGLMGLMLTWHQNGYSHQPEEMAIIASNLVMEPLFPNLETMF